MITKAKKTGNSVAIPLPKAILELYNLSAGSEFEIVSENDQPVIRPINQRKKLFEESHQSILTENEMLFTRLADK